MIDEQPAKELIKPDHISYREYKKRLAKKPHQSFVIFVSTFFVLLLAFLGVAKMVSPKVDLAIGEEPEVVYEQESDAIVKGSIDDRLKQIQDEDNSFTGAVDSGFSYELDEKVVIPTHKNKNEEVANANKEESIILSPEEDSLIPQSVKEQIKEIQARNAAKEAKLEATESAPVPSAVAPTPKTSTVSAPVPVQPKTVTAPVATVAKAPVAPIPTATTRVYKVYVGNYDSAAQAEVAKVIIAEAGLSMNTFVKNVNGSYTLQAGSYSSQDTAFKVAEDLLKNNFPARVEAE